MEEIRRLHTAAWNPKVSSNLILRQRRSATLVLMENLGALPSQLSCLTVKDVEQALSGGPEQGRLPRPMVRVRIPRVQLVPVATPVLRHLADYLVHRHTIFQASSADEGSGRLLISATTGKPLSPDTIAGDLRVLKRAAGLQHYGRLACSIRARFIVNLILCALERPDCPCPPALELLRPVLALAGLRELHSLARYFYLAMQEVKPHAEAKPRNDAAE